MPRLPSVDLAKTRRAHTHFFMILLLSIYMNNIYIYYLPNYISVCEVEGNRVKIKR